MKKEYLQDLFVSDKVHPWLREVQAIVAEMLEPAS